jgi:hypothetical protein
VPQNLDSKFNRNNVIRAIEHGLATWTLLTREVGITFKKVEKGADITFTAGSLSDTAVGRAKCSGMSLDVFSILDKPLTGRCYSSKALIVLRDDDVIWAAPVSPGDLEPRRADVEHVVMHEVGHVLGLQHQEDCLASAPVRECVKPSPISVPFRIVGGPIDRDGRRWWQVKREHLTGWAAEEFLRYS